MAANSTVIFSAANCIIATAIVVEKRHTILLKSKYLMLLPRVAVGGMRQIEPNAFGPPLCEPREATESVTGEIGWSAAISSPARIEWHVVCLPESKRACESTRGHGLLLARTCATLACEPIVEGGRRHRRTGRGVVDAVATSSPRCARRSNQRGAKRLLTEGAARRNETQHGAATEASRPGGDTAPAQYRIPLARYLPPGGLFFDACSEAFQRSEPSHSVEHRPRSPPTFPRLHAMGCARGPGGNLAPAAYTATGALMAG